MSTHTSDPAALSADVKAEARRLGFAGCAVLPAAPARTHAFYEAWLAADYAGAMGYLRRHAAPKRDPRHLLPEARAVIALSHAYAAPPPAPPADGTLRGRVSRYAWGMDYHDVLEDKATRLAAFLERRLGKPLRWRACVDASPLLERELAARAGLGWVGRNAMLIHWRHGSWLFLAELLVDTDLAPDAPPSPRRGAHQPALPPPDDAPALRPVALGLLESCGSCTACIAACPTGAIVGDKTVDARRCISYLTIELKGPIPTALRPAVGEWVFGCDVCQDVCPWNRRAPPGEEPAFQPEARYWADTAYPSLAALLGLDDAAFRARYRHTALWRPRRRGVLRNAAIALGNRLAEARRHGTPPDDAALQALRRSLGDAEPLVRGAAAWALGQSASPEARPWLCAAQVAESDPDVRMELDAALEALIAPGDQAPRYA
jgi:epoxyqueuosine reductase